MIRIDLVADLAAGDTTVGSRPCSDGFRPRDLTPDFSRGLVLAQAFIDDLAQQIVLGSRSETSPRRRARAAPNGRG